MNYVTIFSGYWLEIALIATFSIVLPAVSSKNFESLSTSSGGRGSSRKSSDLSEEEGTIKSRSSGGGSSIDGFTLAASIS